MTQIKIEVPANDHIALSAMADALQRIAAERTPQELTVSEIGVTQSDAEVYGKTWSEHYGSNAEQFDVELEHASQPVDVEIARMDVEFEEAVESINNIEPTPTEQDDTLDADGLPWDKRIHSRGKTRLSDNTWRLARKPNDKTDEEWSAYVESVKSELKAVQDIPSDEKTIPEEFVETVHIPENIVNEVLTSEPTLDEQAVADLTPPVIDEPAVQMEGVTPNGDVAIEPPVTTTGAPVAPVTPPTSLTPPVVEPTVEADTTELSDWDKWLIKAKADAKLVETFQELMLYITGNAKKRGADNDMIKATLAEVDPALIAIPLIATRADLIPKFVTALEVKLS